MTVKQLYDSLFDAAAVVYDAREAARAVYVILEEIFGLSKIDIVLNPSAEAPDTSGLDNILYDISRARPVQYITGRAYFRGLTLSVAEGVLVPRAETEELVGHVVRKAAEMRVSSDRALKILDIGTGSGAICLALASELGGAEVVGIDMSDRALGIARSNALSLGLDVDMAKVDVFSNADEWGGVWEPGTFDIVVSNPPYIPASDREDMHPNVVCHEPHEALFVPSHDRIIFYTAIARRAACLLRENGMLWFEIYEHAADEVADMLRREGFSDVDVKEDLNGRPRIVSCIKRG